jgi:hypothetical protein
MGLRPLSTFLRVGAGAVATAPTKRAGSRFFRKMRSDSGVRFLIALEIIASSIRLLYS